MTLSRGLKYGGRTIAVLGAVLLLFVVYQLWGTSLQYARAQSGLRDDFSSLLSQTASFRDGAADGAAISDGTAGGTSGTATLSSDTATLSSGTAMLSSGTAKLSSGTARLRAAGTEAGPSEASAQTLTAPSLSPSGASASGSESSASDAATSGGTSSASSVNSLRTETGATGSGAAGEAAEATSRKTLLVSPNTRLPRAEIENADLVYTPGAEEILPLLYPEDGNAVSRIIIPAIKIDEIVVEGTDVDALRKGPGHYSWTPMPGQPGNASIAGHRTTYGAPFANIGNLRPGDRITAQTAQGEFVYEVLPQDLPTKGYLIVSPDRVDLLRDKGNNLLTLTSCHPRFSNRQRIVVQAKLLGDPVVPMRNLSARQDAPQELVSEDLTGATGAEGRAGTSEGAAIGDTARTDNAAYEGSDADSQATSGVGQTLSQAADSSDAAVRDTSDGADSQSSGVAATSSGVATGAASAATSPATDSGTAVGDTAVGDSFGSGLSGERSAIPSAVLWFVATVALWAAVWLVGTRWRRIPSISIGILPVLGCLFVAFSYLDRALPSY